MYHILRVRQESTNGAHPNSTVNPAAHAASNPTVPIRILGQLLLVILPGVINRWRISDLGGDAPAAQGPQRAAVFAPAGLGGRALRGIAAENNRAVLGADVVALPHALCRIVRLPEQLQQGLVGNRRWIVDHEHHFSMPGPAAAHLAIVRVDCSAAGIAHGRGVDAALFPEQALCAPEASHAEQGLLEARGKWRPQGMPIDEVIHRFPPHAHRPLPIRIAAVSASTRSLNGHFKLTQPDVDSHYRAAPVWIASQPADPRPLRDLVRRGLAAHALVPHGGGARRGPGGAEPQARVFTTRGPARTRVP